MSEGRGRGHLPGTGLVQTRTRRVVPGVMERVVAQGWDCRVQGANYLGGENQNNHGSGACG